MIVAVLLTTLALANPAVIIAVHGEATIQTAEGSVPATRYAKIRAGTTLKTGPGARLSLRLPSGSLIRVGPQSMVELEALVQHSSAAHRKESLKLKVGRVWAQVKALTGADSTFHIKTPQAVAGVRGTTFWAETTPETWSFILEEGSLAVQEREARAPLTLSGQGAGIRGSQSGGVKRFSLSAHAMRSMRSRIGGARHRLSHPAKRHHRTHGRHHRQDRRSHGRTGPRMRSATGSNGPR